MHRSLSGLISALLLDADATEGGAATTTTTTPPAKGTEADPAAGFNAALKAHGDNALAFAREMWAKAEGFRAQADEAKAKLPRAGAAVLEGDDLAEWNAYRGLGRKAAEVKADLDALPTVRSEVAGYRRRDQLAEAAAAHGSDGQPLRFSAKVLGRLAGDLPIEVVDAKVNGRDVRLAQVVTTAKDDKGTDVETRTPLDKFAAKEWAEFLPSLRQAPAAESRGTPAGRQAAATPAIQAPQRPARSLPTV